MGWEIHRLWFGGRHQRASPGESTHLFSSLRTFERRYSQVPLTSSPISPRRHAHDAPLFPTQIPRLHDSAPDVFRTLRLLRGITTSTTSASTSTRSTSWPTPVHLFRAFGSCTAMVENKYVSLSSCPFPELLKFQVEGFLQTHPPFS